MKRKVIPMHKEVKITSIKTYNKEAMGQSRSTGLLSSLILKSDNKVATKQKKHYPSNPETINRF